MAEFLNEVRLLSSIQHPHIVRLLGFAGEVTHDPKTTRPALGADQQGSFCQRDQATVCYAAP